MKSTFFPDYREVKKRSGTSSKKIGDMVHRQLFHAIECVKNGRECTCLIKTSMSRLHRFTKQAITKLKELQIEITNAEVPILCRGANVCTHLDMIGRRKCGNNVIISTKTGYATTFDQNPLKQRMKKP